MLLEFSPVLKSKTSNHFTAFCFHTFKPFNPILFMHSSTILFALLTLGYSVALPVAPYLVRRGPSGPRQTEMPPPANDVVRLTKRRPTDGTPTRPTDSGKAPISILKPSSYLTGGTPTPKVEGSNPKFSEEVEDAQKFKEEAQRAKELSEKKHGTMTLLMERLRMTTPDIKKAAKAKPGVKRTEEGKEKREARKTAKRVADKAKKREDEEKAKADDELYADF
jgi:hypothetical protein